MTRCGVLVLFVCFFSLNVIAQKPTINTTTTPAAATTLTTEENEENKVATTLKLVSTAAATTATTPTIKPEPVTTPNAQPQIQLTPFSQLAHGLKSGPITILDNKTLFIPNLYYDGKGPDAHFWAGNGSQLSSDGILVPNEKGSNESLSAYTGKNVTITLPNNLTVDQIDHFGLWCIKFNQNFGHVLTPKGKERISLNTKQSEPLNIQLEPFKQLAHGLRSGPIVILDEHTFFIPDLHYDGKGPDAHFWAGNGPEPSSDGILVPDENGSNRSVSAYNGQNVTIKLPNDLTVDQIDYFGLWCIKFNQNFGHVLTPRGKEKTIKHVQVEPLGIQLEPFKQLAHGLRSGPIIIVDKQTFFVPNLHYDGKGPDAHFWVGNGKEPSPSGILVPDEKGSKATISAYNGQNVYIRLPEGVTIDKIDYFGVWCIQYKHNFGHVEIPKNLKIPEVTNPSPEVSPDNKTIMRIQKCCALGEVLTMGGCKTETQAFVPMIDVHIHNNTHIDDEPIAKEALIYAPFVNHIDCENRQYPLIPGDDAFALLKNGSLMVMNTQQILSQDDYCVETVDFGDETGSDWMTTAIICFGSGEVPTSSTLFVIYAVGISISAIFLVITALVFLIMKELRDTRGKCIVAYTLSMAAGFICLSCSQFYGIDDEKVCNLVGFIIQFFLVSSFTWLTMVSWETYYKIKKHDCDAYSKDRRRLIIYSVIGISVPLLTLIISVVVDSIPDLPNTFMKPHFGRNSCWFDQKQGSMLYFYIPIGLAIFFNIVLAVLMKWTLLRFQRLRKLNISWLTLKHELKPMFRSCTFLLTVMTLCWIMEIVSFLAKSDGGVWVAFDIISSLQGLIIFIIYVLHRPVKDKICKPKRQPRNGEEGRPLHVFKENGIAANHNNHNDFLTNLRHSDSTENASYRDRGRPASDVVGRDSSTDVFNINDATNSTNASQSNYNDFLKNLRFIDSVDDLT